MQAERKNEFIIPAINVFFQTSSVTTIFFGLTYANSCVSTILFIENNKIWYTKRKK